MKKRSRFTVVTKLIGLVKTSYGLYGACCHNGDCRTFVRLLLSRFSEGLPYSILSVLMCRLV